MFLHLFMFLYIFNLISITNFMNSFKIKLFRFLFYMMMVLFLSIFLFKILKNINDKIFIKYIDYCIQKTEYLIINVNNNGQSEFYYIPYAIISKNEEKPTTNKRKKYLNEYIYEKNEELTNQYIKNITGYDMNDMIDFLEKTKPNYIK